MRACGGVSPLFLELEELQIAGLLWHPREPGRLASVTVAIPRTFCYFRNDTSLWTLFLFGQQSKVDSHAEHRVTSQNKEHVHAHTDAGTPQKGGTGVLGGGGRPGSVNCQGFS